MSLPQHILYGVGGTVEINVLARPTNATVTISTSSGSAIITDGTGTLDTINTALSAAVSAEATSLTVSNATGISSGKEFWVRTPDEKTRCKTVSSTTVNLWNPLLYAHSNAASVEGTRITYSVGASNAATLFWDGRCAWSINGTLSHFTSCECTKYPLHRLATVQDLLVEQPLLIDIINSDIIDVERMLDTAHEDVLTKLAAKDRARVFTGSTEFIRATVYQCLSNHYRRQASDDAKVLYERYKTELDAELVRIAAIVPRDTDQDSEIEEDEKISMRSARLMRA